MDDARADAALRLTPPTAVPVVAPAAAPALAPAVDAREVPALEARADALRARLVAGDPGSRDLRAALRDARSLGADDVRAAAETSAAVLAASARAPQAGLDATHALERLRATVEALDPGRRRVGRRLFGLVPVGESADRYFRRYEDAQAELDAVVTGLYDAKDALLRQNATLGIEQERLGETSARLHRWVHVAARLDAGLAAEASAAAAPDAGSPLAEALHAVRARHQDLLVQLAVCVQGHLAVAAVVRTNAELVRGVERATTTTLAALRTAVLTAGALAHRELVLDRVAALDAASRAALRTTAAGARDAGGGATARGIVPLRSAFADVVATLDSLGEFQGVAAASLGTTLDTLALEVERTHRDR
ncbi:toxic anion resistance protein [Cellulomonas sp. PhB143]|uniref:toxic anion resistance protein n=1 Tax=Cellulomonas sp. PhB143 TaxID=2485186 RepID=UPI000F498084|nr:toxic anion resistance protein [Cellulomonas sp. PhB143]ROS77042.1 uncharacterized protein YaaN involved in tellurite resistance [Cellulomonas sp. PhB143]